MARIFLTGGRQRPSTLRTLDEWSAYDCAVVVEVDSETGASRCLLEYRSPPERCPAQPSNVFKAGSWDGSLLLLCTQTEVVWFDPEQSTVVRTLRHPWMNDVHHVERIDGRLHVVSTGLDAVLVFGRDDSTLDAILSVTGHPTWERFDRNTDYRRIATTKPHTCHPNYIYADDTGRWVTRFEQRDAISLESGERTASIASDPIHDGVVDGDHIWFTVVSGEVVQLNRHTRQVEQRFDLDRLGGEGGRPLGWCRGLLRRDGTTWLAFSRLRPTRIKQNLAWLRKPLGKAPEPMPSRLVAYDLGAGQKQRSYEVEPVGISSIFGVLCRD